MNPATAISKHYLWFIISIDGSISEAKQDETWLIYGWETTRQFQDYKKEIIKYNPEEGNDKLLSYHW